MGVECTWIIVEIGNWKYVWVNNSSWGRIPWNRNLKDATWTGFVRLICQLLIVESLGYWFSIWECRGHQVERNSTCDWMVVRIWYYLEVRCVGCWGSSICDLRVRLMYVAFWSKLIWINCRFQKWLTDGFLGSFASKDLEWKFSIEFDVYAWSR